MNWLILVAIVLSTALLCLVLSVADGDTLTVRCPTERGTPQRMMIRITAMDAPERAQPYGQRARQRLIGLCQGRHATVHPMARDRYGRTVAEVRCQNRDVARTLVAEGLAWVYRPPKHLRILESLQQRARKQRNGLWVQKRPVAPWTYRQRQAQSKR